ncbi:unnamed protein product, partial [Polarella glacialis]
CAMQRLDAGANSVVLPLPEVPETNDLAALAVLSRAFWPEDKLMRAVVVAQWSAPSCMNLIVLGHRAGVQDNFMQALAALYLVLYGVCAFTSAAWISAGLAIF